MRRRGCVFLGPRAHPASAQEPPSPPLANRRAPSRVPRPGARPRRSSEQQPCNARQASKRQRPRHAQPRRASRPPPTVLGERLESGSGGRRAWPDTLCAGGETSWLHAWRRCSRAGPLGRPCTPPGPVTRALPHSPTTLACTASPFPCCVCVCGEPPCVAPNRGAAAWSPRQQRRSSCQPRSPGRRQQQEQQGRAASPGS